MSMACAQSFFLKLNRSFNYTRKEGHTHSLHSWSAPQAKLVSALQRMCFLHVKKKNTCFIEPYIGH